jgi:hypothetical protein
LFGFSQIAVSSQDTNAPFAAIWGLAGRGSSETEGNVQVVSLHIEADMLLKGRRNEPAIRLET